MGLLQRIRQKIIDRHYFLSSHALDEMRADKLDRADVENAILHGSIQKRFTRDPRGTRYRISGTARDGRIVCIICRIHSTRDLIIITVYAKD
jgi:hypothetical protein